ncbi:MAG: hypothetical protein AB7T22_17115 [Calditrichaceae bacterium]
MYHLELTAKEKEVLLRVLENQLADLKEEYVESECNYFREQLREKSDTITHLLYELKLSGDDWN